MFPKEVLRQIITEQKKVLLHREKSVPREILQEILPWLQDTRVLILTGLRRSGKSTLLHQIMTHTSGWCYVHFEDERFLDFTAQDFELLHELLIEIYGVSQIYFFDEIQNIEKFETFVRRLQEQGKKVIITGSNASLLSKEFGTRLTGRYKSFEVFPFSFREFLLFKGFDFQKKNASLLEDRVELFLFFKEYFFQGGLPEYLKNKDEDYVRTIYENIIYKDIIARYKIRKQKLLKELVLILSSHLSSLFTYNSLKKSLGLGNAITVKEYIFYLQNSYLFFELLRFDYSLKRQLHLARKIYLVDTVFHKICGQVFSPNDGRILENVVYLELRRRGKDVFYFTGKQECDFIVKNGTKVESVFQVCYGFTKENREREIAGLLEAMDTFNLKEGILLSYEYSEELSINGKTIIIIPVYKWLLTFDLS